MRVCVRVCSVCVCVLMWVAAGNEEWSDAVDRQGGSCAPDGRTPSSSPGSHRAASTQPNTRHSKSPYPVRVSLSCPPTRPRRVAARRHQPKNDHLHTSTKPTHQFRELSQAQRDSTNPRHTLSRRAARRAVFGLARTGRGRACGSRRGKSRSPRSQPPCLACSAKRRPNTAPARPV